MMANQFIELWGHDIHSLPTQVSSIKKARLKATTPDSVDVVNQTAIFPSSPKPYIVSLSSCTCKSYGRVKKPCKHMYRLAMELGLIDGPFETGVNKNNQMSFEDAVAEIENLPDDCQVLIKKQLALDGTDVCYENSPDYIPIIKCRIVRIKTPSANAIKMFGNTKEIVSACSLHGLTVPNELNSPYKKQKLCQWCSENAFGVFLSFDFSDDFQKHHRKVYSYLRRKFDWDWYTGGGLYFRYPYDSKQIGPDSKYYFRDDDVTRLLSLYGHNRCENGFVAEQFDADF